jgi:hypothetical protein
LIHVNPIRVLNFYNYPKKKIYLLPHLAPWASGMPRDSATGTTFVVLAINDDW